jgi:peptide/nickel transport system substrate-binding protein
MPAKVVWIGVLALIVTGCAQPPAARTPAAQPPPAAASAAVAPTTDRTKTITVGITSTVNAMGIVVPAFPVGGWSSMTEIHTEGLISADVNGRAPVGRLAEKVPSLDNGGITMLPDGGMKVVFNLRKGVSWHDGTPFTAQDMVFSYQLGGPGGIPQYVNGAVQFMSSVEAVDPSTVAITYKAPYFQGAL